MEMLSKSLCELNHLRSALGDLVAESIKKADDFLVIVSRPIGEFIETE